MRHNIDEEIDEKYAQVPVLWREVLDLVLSAPAAGNGVLVDATLGEGGHSAMFLRRCDGLRIIAFERDPEILAVARERLAPFADRIEFINDNFANAPEHLSGRGGVDYILYDFGISSYHYERGGRGFAFAKDEDLDMRLDPECDMSAADIVNSWDARRLADIFYTYGEERWSRKIASVIVAERDRKPIETTGELASLVLRSIPKRFHVKNIHPATRVFQALRIAVNDELGAIKRALAQSVDLLNPGGRLMAISFHSLEDRLVKDRLRRLAKGCRCDAEQAHCRCMNKPFIKILTKKPVVPESDETQINNRARSAKLRAYEKLA